MLFLHWVLIGGGAWFIAVALKITGDVLFQRNVTLEFRDWVTAVLSGLWATVCELGLAATVFLIWDATVWEAVAYALGAATVEFLLLLPAAFGGGIEAEHKRRRKDSKAPVQVMTWRNFAIERVIALVGHIASRVLVWIGVAGSGGLAALAAAFGLYTLSEGLAAYGEAKDWNWLNPRVMWPFLIVQTLIVAVTVWLALRWSGIMA
ncbi:MAG: YhfC family intramembrane metalloprotease [Alphaproteobacteria bacterium]|nr:YhfC family intramembrane metalloprotease [Alphaproteobacteria bacterium]